MTSDRGPDSRRPTNLHVPGGRERPENYGGTCPLCGEDIGQFPAHLPDCEERP